MSVFVDYYKKTKLGVVKSTLQMIKISCTDRKSSMMEFKLSDKNKTTLWSMTYDLKMKPIPPETMTEALYLEFCKSNK